MAIKNRIFYQVLGCQVGPTPATGYHFQTGFNNVYTGANSGFNLIQSLSRVQSVSDSFTQTRQNVGQLGQLAILAKMITEPPTVPLEVTYMQADMSNERILGLYVSGNQAAMTNILNTTQAEKNYFIPVAPEGIDAIGWTGSYQVKAVTNGYLTSYSTEGAVGGLPTTTVGVQGFNWFSDTGSVTRPLLAVDYINNVLTTGIVYTLPVLGSGLANAVPVIRPSEIKVLISGVQTGIGLNGANLRLQRYNLSFNLNPQKLTQMGSFFPYSIQPQFPVDVNASVTAYWGDLTTGSLSSLACNDNEYSVTIQLFQPSCLGQPAGALAAQWQLLGAKLNSQAFSDSISDAASTVTLSFTSTLGGPNDVNHNLYLTGISA